MTWKVVDGFPKYEVSEIGQVRSSTHRARTMRPMINHGGYKAVQLYPGRVTRLVHRLVAAAFLGDPNGKQVNHRNGIRYDNHICNLEYVTPSENALHRFHILGHGHSPETRRKMSAAKIGSNHWGSVNPDEEQIRSLRADGLTYREISARVGISKTTVESILRNRHWSNRKATA